MPFRETHIDVAGKRTKLMTGGAGEPLLYLHSAAGETIWLPFHEELSRRFEVFAPAHPGFDTSEGLSEIDSIEDLVFHYLDLFDQMGWQRVHVVGLSLGGWLAAELATREASRLSKLVLVDAAGLHVPDEPMQPMFEHMRDPEHMRRLLFADPESMLARMLVMHPDQMPDELLLRQLKAAEASARVGWSPYFHNPKLAGRLRRIRVPTLVVWGAQDRLIPVAHGRAYAERIPGAKLVVIDGSGHFPILEKTEELVRVVSEFLQ